jgi:hypothetical protein
MHFAGDIALRLGGFVACAELRVHDPFASHRRPGEMHGMPLRSGSTYGGRHSDFAGDFAIAVAPDLLFSGFSVSSLCSRGLESPDLSEFSALFDESTTVESA